MSRSYKHTPYCGDTKNRYAKRSAAKAVRRTPFTTHCLQRRSNFRRLFSSYDICDYCFMHRSFAEWIGVPGVTGKEPEYREDYNYYLKWYRRK